MTLAAIKLGTIRNFFDLFLWDTSEKQRIQRAMIAKGSGLEPADYVRAFPGATVNQTSYSSPSMTTQTQQDPSQQLLPPSGGWKKWLGGALVGASLLGGGAGIGQLLTGGTPPPPPPPVGQTDRIHVYWGDQEILPSAPATATIDAARAPAGGGT